MSRSQQEVINGTEEEILRLTYEGESKGSKKTQNDLSESMNIGKSQVSRKLETLEEKNLVDREVEGCSKKLSLTEQGCRILLSISSSTPSKYNKPLSIHKFALKFPIENIDEVEEKRGESWRQQILANKEAEVNYNQRNDSYSVKESNYTCWINRKNVIIFIEDIEGRDPILLKEKAIERALEVSKKVEIEFKIELSKQYSGIRAKVSNEHVAIIGDPFSKLVHETDYEGCNIKIQDEKGRIRLWTDDSKGRNDLEAGTQFKKHGFAEEDIETLLRFYRWLLNNGNFANTLLDS
ncbi:hypothetical protein GLT81_00430 [Nanohaloarchaea archaeon]|nr:hypothetical protein [Candidatus Nanohaloarchaea archaeon]